jgi:hypothetical protein
MQLVQRSAMTPILLLEITKLSDREARMKPYNYDYVDGSDMAKANDGVREERKDKKPSDVRR